MLFKSSATNKPVADGRYCCLVSNRVKVEFAEPIVLTWLQGRWHWNESPSYYPYKVFGFSPLLPIGRLDELFPEEPELPKGERIEAGGIDQEAVAARGWWERTMGAADPAKIPLEYDL